MSQLGNSVNYSGAALDDFFQQYRARGEPLVLATVVHTIGSTYRKAGAQMLIARDGNGAGLLSGGCLESDLMERARKVLDTGEPLLVEYDTRSSDDVIWGIGLGCEGAMRILLTRLAADNDYQPFAYAHHRRSHDEAGGFALTINSDNTKHPVGSSYLANAASANTVMPAALQQALLAASQGAPRNMVANVVDADDASFLVVPVELPVRLLILGAGPDVMPLVEIAGLMGWNVTVLDHRPAYAVPERFPRARNVVVNPANRLNAFIEQRTFDAAVVMSHHLVSDQLYLEALADSAVVYIGLLGPAPRRIRLLREIGDKAEKLGERLYGPIGLDLGARTPESIALSIVAEIQAVLNGHSARSFSRL